MSLQWRMMQNLKRKWLVVSKLTWEMRQVFTRALESLNDFHFNMLLLSKVYTVWGKKVQRSYIHDTEEWYKIWKEINLWFQNWHKEFNNFWPEHSKVSKIFTCMCSFWTSYIFWARKVQTSYLSWHWRVMQNLKKNWVVVWKMTWGIWQIFTRVLEIVKIGTLMAFFCPK